MCMRSHIETVSQLPLQDVTSMGWTDLQPFTVTSVVFFFTTQFLSSPEILEVIGDHLNMTYFYQSNWTLFMKSRTNVCVNHSWLYLKMLWPFTINTSSACVSWIWTIRIFWTRKLFLTCVATSICIESHCSLFRQIEPCLNINVSCS